MKKQDLLKLLEDYPEDMEVTFYDSEYGEYVESFKIKGVMTLGRFKHPAFSREFYAPYRVRDSWEYLGYDTKVLVLEGE